MTDSSMDYTDKSIPETPPTFDTAVLAQRAQDLIIPPETKNQSTELKPGQLAEFRSNGTIIVVFCDMYSKLHFYHVVTKLV